MARKKIIAGNWKMNMTPSQTVELINTLKPLVSKTVYRITLRNKLNKRHCSTSFNNSVVPPAIAWYTRHIN